MALSFIKTIQDLIFYQYAKIISKSSGINTYPFIISTMKRLSSGKIKMSTHLRELKIQISSGETSCEYCGSKEDLSWDHIIPKSKGGLDVAENHLLACRRCNSSKGSKGIYEWYGVKRKDELPRLVAGKYLKLLYEIHQKKGTLNSEKPKEKGLLTVLDLEGF